MILELKQISKNFGGLSALSTTSFSIAKNEIFALIGPNGAGKTTLFNIITGNYQPSSGQVLFTGRKITGLKPHKILRLGIARTFQNIRLFASMSVLENVLIGFHSKINYGLLEAFTHLGRFGRTERIFRARAMEILDGLGLADLAGVRATTLSYGQQRKVELARALASEPTLLLLDEPVAGMNAAEGEELARIITGLKSRLSVLLIEHDMGFVNRLASRVLVLDYGRVIFEGSVSEAVRHEEVVAAYLGDFYAGS